MHTDDEAIALKLRCVDLLFDCPHQRCNANCPFAQVRANGDILARINWLKQMTVSELRQLVARHTSCSQSP